MSLTGNRPICFSCGGTGTVEAQSHAAPSLSFWFLSLFLALFLLFFVRLRLRAVGFPSLNSPHSKWNMNQRFIRRVPCWSLQRLVGHISVCFLHAVVSHIWVYQFFLYCFSLPIVTQASFPSTRRNSLSRQYSSYSFTIRSEEIIATSKILTITGIPNAVWMNTYSLKHS